MKEWLRYRIKKIIKCRSNIRHYINVTTVNSVLTVGSWFFKSDTGLCEIVIYYIMNKLITNA